MEKRHLLAIVPDPTVELDQPGGIRSAARAVFGSGLMQSFDVRIVDTTMRAYPKPDLRERVQGGASRVRRTLSATIGWRPEVALAFCTHGVSTYEKIALLLLAKQRGAKVYLSPRSGHAESWLSRDPAARLLIRYAGQALDGFIVQSESWREVYARFGVPADKIHVWYNPVDTDAWAPVAAEKKPNTGERPFRFLFLAWAIENKGLRELVEAAARLEALDGPRFELAVAGDGQFGRELLERQKHGRLPHSVELLGWVVDPERTAELKRADALVLPTYAEGFPNVLVEAMACALPVITTPVGAIPEIVVDGKTGTLVPIKSVDRLLAAMDWMRRHRVEAWQMGQAGLERARERFGLAAAVERLVEILRSGEQQRG